MAQARYEQDHLPNFLEEEAKARESDISYATYFRHKRAVALRWFKYYRSCKDEKKKMKLFHQYNMIARMR